MKWLWEQKRDFDFKVLAAEQSDDSQDLASALKRKREENMTESFLLISENTRLTLSLIASVTNHISKLSLIIIGNQFCHFSPLNLSHDIKKDK